MVLIVQHLKVKEYAAKLWTREHHWKHVVFQVQTETSNVKKTQIKNIDVLLGTWTLKALMKPAWMSSGDCGCDEQASPRHCDQPRTSSEGRWRRERLVCLVALGPTLVNIVQPVTVPTSKIKLFPSSACLFFYLTPRSFAFPLQLLKRLHWLHGADWTNYTPVSAELYCQTCHVFRHQPSF